MLEELVAAKKISHQEYQTYVVFALSESGRNWLNRMMDFAFMDIPNPLEMTTELLAFCEGRRAILREIKMNIYKVDQVIQEENYERPEPRN